jgi:hypothetical protein
MAKTTGLGDDLYVGGYHIGGDIQSLVVAGGNTPLDVTDITQSARSRLGGVRAGSIKVVAYHDNAVSGTTSAHLEYAPLPTTDVITSYLRGQALGNPVACCNARQLNYDPTRSAAGDLTFAVDAESDGFGVEWGIQLTADPRTDTTATTGAFYDQGAGAAFGGQAYFQVVSVVGTSVTIDIQSATTSGGSYTTTGLTTTAITPGAAPTAQRLATANNVTINEFLKVVTTGTFTSAVFFVAFMLNPVAGVVF